MRGQHGTANYPQFPEIEAEIGYNPAVWLHTRSQSGLDTGQGQTPELATAMAIVKGIDDPEELANWFKVERRCRNREHVIRKLEERRRAITHDRDGFLQEADADADAAVDASAGEIAADGGEADRDD
jgi:hypothetical protein